MTCNISSCFETLYASAAKGRDHNNLGIFGFRWNYFAVLDGTWRFDIPPRWINLIITGNRCCTCTLLNIVIFMYSIDSLLFSSFLCCILYVWILIVILKSFYDFFVFCFNAFDVIPPTNRMVVKNSFNLVVYLIVSVMFQSRSFYFLLYLFSFKFITVLFSISSIWMCFTNTTGIKTSITILHTVFIN